MYMINSGIFRALNANMPKKYRSCLFARFRHPSSRCFSWTRQLHAGHRSVCSFCNGSTSSRVLGRHLEGSGARWVPLDFNKGWPPPLLLTDCCGCGPKHGMSEQMQTYSQIEWWQIICQIECQKVRKNVRIECRKNVRIDAAQNARMNAWKDPRLKKKNRFQIEMPNRCQKECQHTHQKNCQNINAIKYVK